jgi:hypothetical protein
MEENIKILEEKLKQWEPYKDIRFKTDIELELQMENRAIENLIKGYRELEEENKKWEEWAENAEYDMSVDYIPKSKIKEKIEELENTKLCSDRFYQLITEDKIKLLQELMEDK